ncbi:MAG: hypothetical protein NVS2B14_10980 [Chamaesiphon sp.]
MKILVIEDQQDLREDILLSLEYMDFEGIGAENGKVGVQLAQQHKPELIICDIMMPELDGYQVLTALRQLPETADILFIFLSAKADKSDIRQAMNLGAEDYLTKPFTIKELSQAISTQIKKRELRKSQSQQELKELRGNILNEIYEDIHQVVKVEVQLQDELKQLKSELEETQQERDRLKEEVEQRQTIEKTAEAE